jgi:hypothetical protein
MPKVDILIVSCERHFPWLRYALKSCVRFASGFRQVLVMIPNEDLTAMNPLLAEFSNNTGIPIRVRVFDDWPAKGFLRHEDIIMHSDEHTDADFIFHMDSDCTWVEPTTPDDYFEDGKPVLLHASYYWLVNFQQANLGMWKDGVEKALGGTSDQEFMRRPQMMHPRKTYAKARECIEKHTGRSCSEYIHSCENSFPQTFGEHNTLGEVAWRHFHNDYSWKDQEKGEFPKPHKIAQWWSNSPPTEPQSPVIHDKPWTGTPDQLLNSL